MRPLKLRTTAVGAIAVVATAASLWVNRDRAQAVLVVQERLVMRPGTTQGVDVESVLPRVRYRWTADEIASTWLPVAGEPGRTLRSPEIELHSLDDVAAVVVELAPSVSGKSAVLMWSDQPRLTAGDRARNRRELRPTAERPTRTLVTGSELRGETAAPLRHVFLQVPSAGPSAVTSVAVVATADQIALSPTGLTRRSVGGEIRDAIYVRAGCSIALPVEGRASATLDFGLHAIGSSTPVQTRVVFSSGSSETLLFEGDVQGSRWQDVRVRWPSPGAGSLKLSTEGETSGIVFWSNPRLLAAERDPRRPNVILYVVDTLRADRVGLYGAPPTSTPFLDAMGRGGVVFDRAYAAAAWTKPSVASLFTALYPRTHGMGARYYSDPLPSGVHTLQAYFASAGYTTAQFSANPLAGALSNLDRGFDEAFDPEALVDDRPKVRADDLNRRVLPWLDAHAGERFFLHIQSVDAHPPFRLASDPEAGDRPVTYEEAIAYGDERIARLYRRLTDLGLASQTLFVVTADHGEAFGEHGQQGHGQSVYEEEVRVPLIMCGPGLSPGTRVRQPVSLAELAPTLLDLSAISYDASLLQGRTVARWIDATSGGTASDTREARPVFLTRFAYPEDTGRSVADRREVDGILDFPWKLIAIRSAGVEPRFELYNLHQDPFERRDLALADPARTRRLHQALQGFLETQARARAQFLVAASRSETRSTEQAVAPDVGERLKALGYAR